MEYEFWWKYDMQREQERKATPEKRDMKAEKSHQPHYQHHHHPSLHANPVGVLFCFLCQLENPGRQYVLREILNALYEDKKDSQFIFTRLTKLKMLPPSHSAFFSLRILKLVHTPQTSTLYVDVCMFVCAMNRKSRKRAKTWHFPIVCIFSVSWLFLFFFFCTRYATQHSNT